MYGDQDESPVEVQRAFHKIYTNMLHQFMKTRGIQTRGDTFASHLDVLEEYINELNKQLERKKIEQEKGCLYD